MIVSVQVILQSELVTPLAMFTPSDNDMFTLVDASLEDDSKEVNEIFDKINEERSILIEKDKLLNDRYKAIYEGIRIVCLKRMDLKEKMEENKDSENLKAKMEYVGFARNHPIKDVM